MCPPSLPKDTSADQAKAAAAERQGLVTQGQQSIDSAFSKFDDGYFGNYRQSYLDNFNPQVDDQFELAKQQDTYNQARKGVLNSSPAIFSADRLNKGYGEQRQKIAADAIGAENDLRSNVANQKSQLLALNESAANPTLAAERASAASGTISSTPQYTVLGDLFGGLVNAGAGYMAGRDKSLPSGYDQYFRSGASLPGGSGSGRVVR